MLHHPSSSVSNRNGVPCIFHGIVVYWGSRPLCLTMEGNGIANRGSAPGHWEEVVEEVVKR